MPEDKYTRCPGCKTIFRVTEEQLALRAGQVRCGYCRNVFDGHAERISLSAVAPAAGLARGETSLPSFSAARPGAWAPESSPATRRASDAGAVPSEARREASDAASAVPQALADGAPAAASGGDLDRSSAANLAELGEGEEAVDAATPATKSYAERFASPRLGRLSRVFRVLTVAAVPVLVATLVGQAAFHFRDALAAHVPALKPLLVQACGFLGCSIGPLQENSGLSIEASDLHADPGHRGLLILTVTLRNRAALPLAFPYLELTLTNAQDEVVVRRVLLPAEYVGTGADLGAGIAANAELPIKLFLDASATTQAGYRLYAFYP